MNESCGNCKFWGIFTAETRNGDPLNLDNSYADCRRYPPTRNINIDAETAEEMDFSPDAHSFPETKRITWCGEFKPCAYDAPVSVQPN